jgi:hypothetical protein
VVRSRKPRKIQSSKKKRLKLGTQFEQIRDLEKARRFAGPFYCGADTALRCMEKIAAMLIGANLAGKIPMVSHKLSFL